MTALLRRADDVLRGRPVAPPWGLVVLCGLAYGGVMGSFGGLGGDRPWMVAFAAIKVPLLLVATLVLSLPSFFVLNTLVGRPRRLRRGAPRRGDVAGGAGDPPRRAGAADGLLVRLVGRLPRGDPLQRGDVRRRQPRAQVMLRRSYAR